MTSKLIKHSSMHAWALLHTYCMIVAYVHVCMYAKQFAFRFSVAAGTCLPHSCCLSKGCPRLSLRERTLRSVRTEG